MKIHHIRDRIRNDIFGVMICEHCRNTDRFVGYDDAYYHNNVIPKLKCKACGKDRAGDLESVA